MHLGELVLLTEIRDYIIEFDPLKGTPFDFTIDKSCLPSLLPGGVR